ncbi:MAG TPA: NAD(P)/FAD-dependent oxidoreductase, partial [Candidatus Omnitrophica bacterium]|nr:NAD(P)/FAD-dependent oxidoreductase [Candidatus Omnitrophota bacterium]
SIILESALRKQNCSIIKENTIARVKGKGGKLREVMLKTGKLIPTNLLIIAVGVKPNLDLLEDTPIKYEQGILVDDFMQTNVRNIYAAGDAAQGKDFLLQKKSLLPIWPVAARQGKVAGFNMAGREKKYEGLFIMNSVELAGIPTISFGITNPPESHNYEILLRKNEGENFYRKLVLRNNRIVGGIFLGKIERAGIFSGLIKNEVNVSSFKNELLSDQFGLLVLPEEYRKHLVTGEGIEV